MREVAICCCSRYSLRKCKTMVTVNTPTASALYALLGAGTRPSFSHLLNFMLVFSIAFMLPSPRTKCTLNSLSHYK